MSWNVLKMLCKRNSFPMASLVLILGKALGAIRQACHWSLAPLPFYFPRTLFFSPVAWASRHILIRPHEDPASSQPCSHFYSFNQSRMLRLLLGRKQFVMIQEEAKICSFTQHKICLSCVKREEGGEEGKGG